MSVLFKNARILATENGAFKVLDGAYLGVSGKKINYIGVTKPSFSYDTEKDKLNVEGDIAKEMFRMRRKYDNYVDILESAYIAIEQIEEEEKQRKEEEKARKAEERAAKRNTG